MAKAVINVDGMSCNHCKMSVEKALKTIDGVQNAVVDLGANTVEIDFDSGTVDETGLKKTITDAGYEVK